MSQKEESHVLASYGTYLLVWLGLVVFTGLTVTMAGFHFGPVNVFLVLLVAAVKSSLVLLFFMHLKYDKSLFPTILVVALLALAIFIGLTFLDILFR